MGGENDTFAQGTGFFQRSIESDERESIHNIMERITGTKRHRRLFADYYRGNFDVLWGIVANFLVVYRCGTLPVLRAGLLVGGQRDKVTAVFPMFLSQFLRVHIGTFSHTPA